MKLSLIIPAYNEDQRLPSFLDTINEYVKLHTNDIYEIIIIDDGSSDKTFSVAKSYSSKLPNLQVLQHEQNTGKGGAIQTGVKAATGDAIVFTDADGATPITELPKMIAALKENQIGIGNRWQTNSHAEKSTLLRHFAGWVYKTYMGFFGLTEIDTMCGFKGYRKDVADDLFDRLIDKRWLFDVEIAYKAVREKYSINNFPIEWHSVDGSKLSSIDLVKSALGIFPLIQKVKRQAFSDYNSETQRTYDTYPEQFDKKFTKSFQQFGKKIADEFIATLPGSKVIDIGSGPGIYAKYFQEKGFDVVCVDTSKEMIRLCKERGLNAFIGDVLKLDFDDNTFDGVWAQAVLLHLPREKVPAAIKEIIRVLKDGGIANISVKEGRIEGYEERQSLPDTKRWFTHFTDQEMRTILQGKFDIINFSRTNVDNNRFTFIHYLVKKIPLKKA